TNERMTCGHLLQPPSSSSRKQEAAAAMDACKQAHGSNNNFVKSCSKIENEYTVLL
ncbi:hypothetical protein A2U01_0053949, partial [Trifolium medium]|nr:hypothetical protein [Trifolium medium]